MVCVVFGSIVGAGVGNDVAVYVDVAAGVAGVVGIVDVDVGGVGVGVGGVVIIRVTYHS